MLRIWARVLLYNLQLRYNVGFGLVELAISTNPKPTMCRNLYENAEPGALIGPWVYVGATTKS